MTRGYTRANHFCQSLGERNCSLDVVLMDCVCETDLPAFCMGAIYE